MCVCVCVCVGSYAAIGLQMRKIAIVKQDLGLTSFDREFALIDYTIKIWFKTIFKWMIVI